VNATEISLRDLEYILAVARYSSFSQAAEACSVSQPALSKQIKSVESTLGMAIFERSKRQVLLTDVGRLIVKQAQVVMDEAEKLVRLAAQNQAPLSGHFRLGCIASSCPYLLPYFVGTLTREFPDLKLLIKEGLTVDLIQDLRQGNLDAVIAASTFEDTLLQATPLFFEPFLLAEACQGNVISSSQGKTKSKVTIEDINPDALLLLEDGHCLKDQTLELCSLQGHSALNFRAASLETLLQMTAGGLGVSVIPVLAKPEAAKFGNNLRFWEFSDSKLGRTMLLYSRISYALPENIRRLAQFIQARLPESVRVL
jgi:LysR family transcriptional regulator, hydrogen peroxide-inducible genes activator